MSEKKPQSEKVRAIMDAIARSEKTGEEFCVMCGRDMGFPALTTHIEDPIRYRGGDFYVEGCGQVCVACMGPRSDWAIARAAEVS